jgi:MFS family permease
VRLIRPVAVLPAVLYLDAALFGALIPLLPAIRDANGLGKTAAGLLFGAYAVGALVGGIPAGLLARRVGARRAVGSGLVVLAASTLAFALVEAPAALGVARFAQGVSSIVTWSGILGWISAATPRERRGQALGLAFGVAVFGFITGPALGSLARETSVKGVFLALGGAAACLAFVVLALPRPPAEAQTPGAVRRALADPRFLAGLWLNLLPALFFGVLDVLATLDLDAGGFGAIAVATVFVAGGAVEVIVNPLLGRLSDRRGRLLPIRVSLATSIAVTAGLAATGHPWAVAGLVIASSLSVGGFYTPGLALIADRAEAAGLSQSLGFGLSNTVWAAGASLGPMAGAALADATSDAVPYGLCAVLCAATLWAVTRGGGRRSLGADGVA